MNIKLLSKIGIIFGSILVGTYILFLLLPFVLNFAIDRFTPQIVGEINKLTGLSSGLEGVQIVTTPKLTAGLKVKKFELYTPNKEPIFISDNFKVKMSLLPILAKNIRIDVIQVDNADVTLKFNNKGELDLVQYLPQQEQANMNLPQEDLSQGDLPPEDLPPEDLPLPPLKLSNHLPDIHVGGYKVTITDGKDNYVLSGGKTDITDFILNKSIKIKGDGKFTLKGREQFKFDVNILNKIMPDADLNELVFNPQEDEKAKEEKQSVDIISILKGLYDYKLTANLYADLKTETENIDGIVKIDNVSLIDITPSNAELKFKGNSIDVDANMYTAQNEVSTIKGKITTGKKPYIDMNFKTGLQVANALNIVKKVALIFNIKDLQTLTANGQVNADFNIKSDMKSVKSNGYLRVPTANLYYGAYKIGVDNITADVSLANNNINIKNIGFTILGQPLKLFGKIMEDAVSDLHLTANNLSLKGLIVAVGQAALLKENPVYSGTVSMDAVIKGKLDKINPVINIDVSNVDLKNLPADIRLKAPNTRVNITSDGKTFGGSASSTNASLINPIAKVSIPSIKANIKEDVIEISQTPVTIEKIKATVSGKITNYLTEKIGLDFVTTGDIKSTLKGDLNAVKQSLNLTYATIETSTIIIPLFDKSKMSFIGKINITGSMMNPIVSGTANVPSISIPEVPVEMRDMDLKLYGTILHGSGTVKEFVSGGIKAENCSADFELKGNDFYLNNLKGSAFKGKINGNIVYNLANAKTKVEFHGSGMNAEKAIEGAAGIKKALTGTLGFNTKLTLTVLDYNDMIKSMKGNLDFNIKNGAFLSIGRFENLLNANNIMTNALLKNTISSISNATGLATTGEFEILKGDMTFSNGWADLKHITSSGKSLCYYVTGKFNLLNFTTNVNILGRLDAPMVAKLGVLGQLSADKILGTTLANVIKVFTTNPAGENIASIPNLANGSTNYKDFKVVFNGGLESPSSIKSFKWLSNPDMSEVEQKTIKETIKDIKSSAVNDVQTTIDSVNDTIKANKQMLKDTKDAFNATKEDYKNLLKSFKKTSAPAAETNVEAPASSSAVQTQTTAPEEVKSAEQAESNNVE